MLRSQLLEQLGKFILNKKQFGPLCVAIDGIDTSGKTKLAKELSFELRKTHNEVIHISLDNFHNPQEIRYRRGKESPEGYYYDSFNYDVFIQHVLQPLQNEDDRKILKAWLDLDRNIRVPEHWVNVSDQAIILVDGIFLQRVELFQFWNLRIFVDITFSTCLERALQRDLYVLGSIENVTRLYNTRYIPAQKIYFERCHPKQQADIIVFNDDIRNPELQFQRAVAG